MRRIVWLLLIWSIASSQATLGQIGGKAGVYSRLGFGARGMGMGNAQTAVVTGDLVGYYNPATLVWADHWYFSASLGVLALERRLNSFSAVIPFRDVGLSLELIESGVSDIDGRDADGVATGALRTSEIQVSGIFARRFGSHFSLGINPKLLYHHLYTDVSSKIILAVDFGFVVSLSEGLTIGASVRDVNSKYKWDTGELYGVQGTTTVNKFPTLYSIGVAYVLPDSLALLATDLETSDQKTFMARCGVEVPLVPELTLRAGIDRIDLLEKGNGVKPTFGFTARKDIDGWGPVISYAFILEPFAPSGMHIVTLSLTWGRRL